MQDWAIVYAVASGVLFGLYWAIFRRKHPWKYYLKGLANVLNALLIPFVLLLVFLLASLFGLGKKLLETFRKRK